MGSAPTTSLAPPYSANARMSSCASVNNVAQVGASCVGEGGVAPLWGRVETNQLAGRIQNNGRHPRHIVRRIALDDDVHRVLRDQVLRTLAVHEADARLEPVFAVACLRDVPDARQHGARALGEDLARLRDSRRIDLRHIADAQPDAEGAGDDGGEQRPRQGRLQRALVSGRRDHFRRRHASRGQCRRQARRRQAVRRRPPRRRRADPQGRPRGSAG